MEWPKWVLNEIRGEMCVRRIGIHNLKVLNLELELTQGVRQRIKVIMTGKRGGENCSLEALSRLRDKVKPLGR
jgi:hypothetical protein